MNAQEEQSGNSKQRHYGRVEKNFKTEIGR